MFKNCVYMVRKVHIVNFNFHCVLNPRYRTHTPNYLSHSIANLLLVYFCCNIDAFDYDV